MYLCKGVRHAPRLRTQILVLSLSSRVFKSCLSINPSSSCSFFATVTDSTTANVSLPSSRIHNILDSTRPVYLPHYPALFYPQAEFEKHIQHLLQKTDDVRRSAAVEGKKQEQFSATSSVDFKNSNNGVSSSNSSSSSMKPSTPFLDALFQSSTYVIDESGRGSDNKMYTDNKDIAFQSTKSPLVDLFYEISRDIDADRLKKLLEAAWKENPLACLKIIFHTRSIHLGKSEKIGFYRAVGWLAENHPLTLLQNLQWLVRPVINKKAKKPTGDEAKGANISNGVKPSKASTNEQNPVLAEQQDKNKEEKPLFNARYEYEVQYGVSHGYWKDLLNILALAVNGQLHVAGDMRSVFNIHLPAKWRGQTIELFVNKSDRPAKQTAATTHDADANSSNHATIDSNGKKVMKQQKREQNHARVLRALESDKFYYALHLTVARLFASQLQEDMQRMQSKDTKNSISLVGKWFPTSGLFHDKHTLITSSIAEILFPDASKLVPNDNRELYFRHAREACRRLFSSPLRKALAVVERDISAKAFDKIRYERIPSVAMQAYFSLFIKKDREHFVKYAENLAQGKTRISGATLLPSTLVYKALKTEGRTRGKKTNVSDEISNLIADGQWKTLVQRIRDSGTLQSAIAVCDVSASMVSPHFDDNTSPLHSAIGLSLLLAEVVQEPFGGAVITFSETPAVLRVGGLADKRTFKEKVEYIAHSQWNMNTNFVAVFEQLILPMALEHKLKQENMVKQVFVFSDMQFDAAESPEDRWTTSFERIQKKFQVHGYEMPQLIFWNLSGAREKISKPVADQEGTALVSGYSQGQMKTFLDSGSLENSVEEHEKNENEPQTESTKEVEFKKKKIDPLAVVKRAISHDSFNMLEVVD